MRMVIVFKYEKPPGNSCHEKVVDGNAIFLAFGVKYEEFEGGPGNYSTAIIERSDGTVENVPVEMIQFLK